MQAGIDYIDERWPDRTAATVDAIEQAAKRMKPGS